MYRVLFHALPIAILVLASLALPIDSRAASIPELPAVVAVSPPPLDGNVDDPRWKAGARVELSNEFNFRKGVDGQSTEAYVLMDAHFLYVGWIAHQSVPVIAQAVTDGGSAGSDDSVEIFLWPGDAQGYYYSFSATPRGTHTESSSENTAFAPRWESAGRRTPDGYEVTMRIPLEVLHAAKGTWRIEFLRNVSSLGLLTLWPYDSAMTSSVDVRYAATLTGVGAIVAVHATRPKPRLEAYGLVQVTSAAAGGSTSRAGLDFSVPEGAGAFYGTIHPDYSNVETDQQSIAPTEFERYYSEVRPFFTQGASFYNTTGVTDLYTPSIRTPRYGYAFEQSHGGLNLAGFNALGDGRDDDAQVASYSSPSQTFSAAFQRTQVDEAGLSDLTQSGSLSFGNGKHFMAFAAYGQDSGSNVVDPSQGRYRVIGAQLYGTNESAGLNLISIGQYYNPVDGYIPYPGTAGYNGGIGKTFVYGANAPIQSVSVSTNFDAFHSESGAINETDLDTYLSIANRHKLTLGFSTGDHELLVGGGLLPFNANYIALSDSADPAITGGVTYSYGRFYDGFARLEVRILHRLFKVDDLFIYKQ